MGVRGLTTYINYNQEAFLHQFFLHDSNLVVDGHSLCAQLYRSLNSFSAFGGDYDKFATYTRNFLKSLRKCNITPYVLFDGSYEPRKLRTAYSRLKSKINGASRLDPVTQGCLQIFPILLRDVFKEVLVEMEIPFTICEFEADDEIAAMARHLNCPILSYDSDFFIYNVLYIPFNTLEFKPKSLEKNGNRINALECRIYRVEHLTDHFGGLKEDLLPLLATLLGNDFVEKQVFKKFFSQLKLPKSKKKNDQQRCIHALFKWIQNETLDSAIAKVLGRLRKDQKDRVFTIIRKSVAGYNRKHCKSLKYFDINDDIVPIEADLNMPDDEEDGSKAETENDSSNYDEESPDDNESLPEDNDITVDNDQVLELPDWLSDGIRHKYIPQSYINLYTHHLHFCSPQAEDYSDDDSFICTLPILRYSFDILTDFSQETFTYVSREKDCNYKRMLIGQDYAIPRLIETPYCELSSEQLNMCFHHFISVKLPSLDLAVIELLPSSFKLYMLSILWWIVNCNVPLSHVHSLIICYIMLEVIDDRTGAFRGHNHLNIKYSKKLEELKKREPASCVVDKNELFLNKNKVQYEDCLIAASVLLKHFEIDDSVRKKPKSYDVRKVHSFAQFQCCLQQFNYLNALCRCPFEGTRISKCYNGTFVYNIALKLEGQDTSSFLQQYLKGASTVLKFLTSLCMLYERCTEQMSLKTCSWSVKKRKRRRKAQTEDEINFIVKGFEFEVII